MSFTSVKMRTVRRLFSTLFSCAAADKLHSVQPQEECGAKRTARWKRAIKSLSMSVAETLSFQQTGKRNLMVLVEKREERVQEGRESPRTFCAYTFTKSR